jgi:chromosome segregation ATPase
MEEKFAESQALSNLMKQDIDSLTKEKEDLKEKLSTSKTLTGRLQEELVEVRSLLSSAQQKVKSLETRDALNSENIEHAEQMMIQLEDSLEAEINARNDALTKLELSVAEASKLREELKAKEEELSEQLDLERERAAKLKQDLSHATEILTATKVSLGSAQHREKMLKHEIAKLEDKQKDTEKTLEGLKTEIDLSQQESSKCMESIRESLTAKAQKELEDLQTNMNRLLEDERKAKRIQDEIYKKKITDLSQNYEKEIEKLKKDNTDGLEKYKKEFDLQLHRLKGEYDEVRLQEEKKAHEERSKLMEKGKVMIKELKEKMGKEIQDLTDDVNFMEEKLLKEEEDKKRLGIQFQTKIVEYKKKLQTATGRINSLSAEKNDFEDKIKILERERFKLREENEKYRRQLGGRSGSDSVLQNQLETLQQEFKSAIEENRELKKRLQSQGLTTLPSIGEYNGSGTYTRDRANQSTLVQLRSEYEETIESLNSEKRELIMKNSAAITDVQKAEKRAWLVEQENSKLKRELTSLKLSNERLENLLSNVQDDNEYIAHSSTLSSTSMLSDLSPIPGAPSGEDYVAEHDNSILSTNKSITNKRVFDRNSFSSAGSTTKRIDSPYSSQLSGRNHDPPNY